MQISIFHMKDKIDGFIEIIRQTWWIILVLYIAFVTAIFSSLWLILEAANVPGDLSTYHKFIVNNFLLSRIFMHSLLALFLAAHFSLVISIATNRYLIAKQDKFKYDNSSNRKILLIAGNPTAIKLIDVVLELGYEVVALYDKNSNAEGVAYAREKGIHTYSHNSDELRKMLRIVRNNQNERYYIFLPTENRNWVDGADQIIRSLRKDTKNIRYYRLGIDFDESVNDAEIASLLR